MGGAGLCIVPKGHSEGWVDGAALALVVGCVGVLFVCLVVFVVVGGVVYSASMSMMGAVSLGRKV
jgi:hypothetical protein